MPSMIKALPFAKFIAAVLAGGFVWMVILPWMSTLPPIEAHIEQMEAANVNVGAMYYTELNWQPPTGAAFR